MMLMVVFIDDENDFLGDNIRWKMKGS